MKRLFLSILLVFVAISFNQATADDQRDLDRAQKSLSKNNYAKAYKQFSDIDHPLAFFTLGLMEELGMGRPPNPQSACDWYRKSAEGGIPTGTFRYAQCLQQGTAGESDAKTAAHWYQEAINLGYHAAACELGKMYMQGEGVEKDPQQALTLCRQAAQSGNPPAMLQLAQWYSDHDLPFHDHQASLGWYEAAAGKDMPEALYQLGMMGLNGHINEIGTKDALPLLERAASQGYAPAYLPVAASYWHKRSSDFPDSPPPNDLAKAYLWAKATVQAGGAEQVLADGKTLLADIRAIMPESWEPELDQKVTAHLAKFHAQPGQ